MSAMGSTPFQYCSIWNTESPTAAVASTATVAVAGDAGSAPLEERRQPEREQRQDVDEAAMPVARAELPVPPAGDDVGVGNQDDRRAGKKRQLPPVANEEAGYRCEEER